MGRPEQLLQRARHSKSGWRFVEVERLYLGFGFAKKESSKHTLFRHPKHPDLWATVRRSSGELPTGYVAKAVHLIDTLKLREK